MTDKKYENGLIVGKFIPPHLGHKYLIDQALQICERVYIVVCSNPDPPKFPARTRGNKITETFKYNQGGKRGSGVYIRYMSPEETPFEFADDYTQREAVKRFIEKSNDISYPEVVFTSEDYGEGFAEHLGVDHVLVDLNREHFNISGTQIREDVYRYSGYLPDPVMFWYQIPYIEKVAFVGAESTGKTTLTKRIAEEYDTLFTNEVGRDFCEGNKWHKYTTEEMNEIVVAQEKLENNLVSSRGCKHFLFCDTCAITTEFYAYEYNQESSQIIDRHCRVVKDRYDIVFLLKNDFPWEDDGTRRLEGDLQRLQQAMIKMQLNHYGIPYIEVGGTLEERVDFVKQYLDQHKRNNFHSVEKRVRERVER